MVAGGGALDPEIWEHFVELAGGSEARIVVIPTAGTQDRFPDDWSGLDALRRAGAEQITLLHTRDPDEANTEQFAAPLQEATGVWIPGGRQWRLVDAYLDTRVHEALFEVLERGGVVGGTSAGASIQASFLVRGDPRTNRIMISPDYEEGFGLLLGAAVDQHLLAREREEDLWEVVGRDPSLLGIGIDEGTALVVRGNVGEVIGASQVLIYDSAAPDQRPFVLEPGDAYDLGRRNPLSARVQEDGNGGGTSH